MKFLVLKKNVQWLLIFVWSCLIDLISIHFFFSEAIFLFNLWSIYKNTYLFLRWKFHCYIIISRLTKKVKSFQRKCMGTIKLKLWHLFQEDQIHLKVILGPLSYLLQKVEFLTKRNIASFYHRIGKHNCFEKINIFYQTLPWSQLNQTFKQNLMHQQLLRFFSQILLSDKSNSTFSLLLRAHGSGK